MSEKQQRLVLSVIDFLNQSINDGTVREEDKESLEVAVQCIGEAFGVDPTDKEQVDRLSVKPATLQTIFDVFLKTKDKIASTAQVTPSTSQTVPASAEDKAAAEKLKQTGNAFMSSKQYDKAIDAYTEAAELDPSNPVYYSNRAAAHSSKGDHLTAAVDAEKAIELDPKFVRGYSRLGHARYSIADYAAAADAYRRGLELEPGNATMKTGLQNSESKTASAVGDATSPSAASSNPRTDPSPGGLGGLGGLAETMRNMGGGGAGGAGGAGGMPDIASLMNNPAMMQMAQQMMANGGMERLMSNPSVANMMDRVNSGGSLPSMEELMANPELQELANQFRGQR